MDALVEAILNYGNEKNIKNCLSWKELKKWLRFFANRHQEKE